MSDRNKREVTAAYYAMVELIDENVGRMIAALEETGQLENTIVIFMSDHGEMLGDHGIYLKGRISIEAAVHVPLIMQWPDQFQANQRADGLMELTDIAPTLLDAAGIKIPTAMQGKTLLPILRAPPIRTPIETMCLVNTTTLGATATATAPCTEPRHTR